MENPTNTPNNAALAPAPIVGGIEPSQAFRSLPEAPAPAPASTLSQPIAAPAATPAAPSTFKVTVGGEELEVGLDELQKGYMRQADYTRKRQEDAKLLQLGESYQRGLTQLQDSPEGAARIIELFVEEALKLHGDEALEPFLSGVKLNTSQVDLSALDENTRNALLATRRENEGLKSYIGQLNSQMAELKSLIEPVVEKAKEQDILPNQVELVKRTIPSAAQLTPADLAEMKRVTGESDPLKAYKLATYDRATSSAFVQGRQQGQAAAVMPEAGGSQLPDISDPSVTADDIFHSLMRQAQNQL